MSGEPSRHHEYVDGRWTDWDCVPAAEVERLRAALLDIRADAAGAGLNKMARKVDAALAATGPPATTR